MIQKVIQSIWTLVLKAVKLSKGNLICRNIRGSRDWVACVLQMTIFCGRIFHKHEILKSQEFGMRIPLAAIRGKCQVEYPAEQDLELPLFANNLPVFYCHNQYDHLHEVMQSLWAFFLSWILEAELDSNESLPPPLCLLSVSLLSCTSPAQKQFSLRYCSKWNEKESCQVLWSSEGFINTANRQIWDRNTVVHHLHMKYQFTSAPDTVYICSCETPYSVPGQFWYW